MNKSALQDVIVTVTAEDACRKSNLSHSQMSKQTRTLEPGRSSFVLDKLTYSFAEHIRAISSFRTSVYIVREARKIPGEDSWL